MKMSNAALLHIILALPVVETKHIAPQDESAQQLCGDLEVLKTDISQLPNGIPVENVRMCKGHPLDQDTFDILDGASLAPVDVSPYDAALGLFLHLGAKRACYYAAPYGCTRGYCWKACDAEGKWCWTAAHDGYGAWIECKTFEDCGQDDEVFSCGKSCQRCGCGC
ncbi:hypothetical protein V8C35DRAFT_304943 [Trichoderma chlorosporum]